MSAMGDQQKDFLYSFFPADQSMGSHQADPHPRMNQSEISTWPIGNQQQGMNPQLNVDLLGSLMQIQGLDSPSSPQASPFNPQLLLEQQFKLTQLQQLQQLQNQIFQQQMALISGQAASMGSDSPVSAEPPREQTMPFRGLPTPASSTELRAQQPMEYVSPMILNSYMDHSQDNYSNHPMENFTSMSSHNASFAPPRGSTSAPEHIAFRPSPCYAPTSPAELDFDISPLTSPWLGAHQQPTQHFSNKRTASSSGDESNTQPSRKKQSPAIRPTNPIVGTKKSYRGSRSTNSTPLLRSSTRSRRGSTAGEVIGDTPSPVDLSMPPPAAPASQAPVSSNLNVIVPPSPNLTPQLTPVTPASIMNLGRLGINSSLSPPTRQSLPSKMDQKTQSLAPKLKPVAESSSRNKPPKKPPGSLVGPSPKAILPAGSGTNGGVVGTPNAGSSSFLPGPVVQVRKTSHKAAEQKRRDSLKTTFDDLRVLLPPIPLPSDEKFPDEPVLPGALPPRGPPKAGGEGPNKGVSKLQLLMCGNDFIRQLKGRVERRDDEIERLRQEVRRLRRVVENTGVNMLNGDMEEDLDLERDLDAVEALSVAFGRGGSSIGDDDGDDDD